MDYGLTLCRDTLVLDEKLGVHVHGSGVWGNRY